MRKGIMLLYPFEESRLNRWYIDFYMQEPKLDGVRMRAILDPNNIQLLSSEENLMNFALPHIVAELKIYAPLLNQMGIYELDGEAYVHGWKFEEINSVCSRDVNLHPDHEQMQYHIFDHIITLINNYQRRKELFNAFEKIDTNILTLVPTYIVSNMSEIMINFQRFLGLGYEGMVVRNPFAKYVQKRSVNAMKFKPTKHDTYMIVDWKEEISKSGRPKGRIGAIVCEKDGDVFSVSAGLNDRLRNSLWLIRSDLPGKMCKIYYQALTKYGIPKFATKLEVL